jgi:lipopolysaccharide/colanic/teichoic acid biosynthesis glycosyltransferase
MTPFGHRLRRLSLDELPTLWNVVRGDMSLVGPRPLLVQYLDRYTPEQRRRHEVAPGITGWAQISGRNAIKWEEKFELDLWYVQNLSLRTDLAILFGTVAEVLGQRGISAEGHATTPEFMGSNDE